jgi:hypothetical protein
MLEDWERHERVVKHEIIVVSTQMRVMCARRRLMAKLVILVAIEDTSISTFFRNFKGRLKSLDYVCLRPFGLDFRSVEMVVDR